MRKMLYVDRGDERYRRPPRKATLGTQTLEYPTESDYDPLQ
jgi:hypothetical protein